MYHIPHKAIVFVFECLSGIQYVVLCMSFSSASNLMKVCLIRICEEHVLRLNL